MDLRENIPILEDGATGEGVVPVSRVEGDSASAQIGLIGFSFKDAAGNVVFPQLTAAGKVPTEVANPTGFLIPMLNREDKNSTETTSGATGTLESDGFGCLNALIEVTAISGTTPSIQIEVQTSDDGLIWTALSNTRRFTATGSQRFISTRISSRYYRYTWTILGTTPSVTFKIMTTLKAYLPRANVQINNYGDMTLGTANNLSSQFNARDTDQVSVMVVRPAAPAGTGQYKVQASNDGANFVDLTGNISISTSETILSTFPDKAFMVYRCIVATGAGGAAICDLFWSASG